MNWRYISKPQCLAIKMTEELAEKVAGNEALKMTFCNTIREEILWKTGESIRTYSKLLSFVLNGDGKIDKLCKGTLKSATQNILNILTAAGCFSEQERAEIVKKVLQGGWCRGVAASQKVQNMQPLSTKEKEILNRIGESEPESFKRGSTRDVKKISEKLENESGIKGTKTSTIKKYMSRFNTNEKRESFLRDDKEEIATLERLFKKYYQPGKKLPIKEIMKQLNEKHDRERNENGIENFIRQHIKTPDQKMEVIKRTDEEKQSLEEFVKNKNNYRYTTGKKRGLINRELIVKTYKSMHPNTIRSPRAIGHQLKKMRENQKKIETDK